MSLPAKGKVLEQRKGFREKMDPSRTLFSLALPDRVSRGKRTTWASLIAKSPKSGGQSGNLFSPKKPAGGVQGSATSETRRRISKKGSKFERWRIKQAQAHGNRCAIEERQSKGTHRVFNAENVCKGRKIEKWVFSNLV